MIPLEKPGSPAELVHHGILGQKWGVTRDNPSGSTRSAKAKAKSNDNTKAYMAITRKVQAKPISEKQRSINVAKNHKRFLEKAEPSEADDESHGHKGLTKTEKRVLIGAGVVAGVAAVGVGAYYLNKTGKLDSLLGKTSKFDKDGNLIEKFTPGEHIPAKDWGSLTSASQRRGWGNDFITEESFKRPEIEIPEGNVFHRISHAAEKSFAPGTYSTHNKEDYERYINAFYSTDLDKDSYENPLYHVSWKSTAPIKVPHITTAIDTMREVLAEEKGVPIDKISLETARGAYAGASGGGWTNVRSENFIKAITSKGYGAIVDEMDAGVVGESPLVVFDKEHMTSKVAELIDNNVINSARDSLTEMKWRK